MSIEQILQEVASGKMTADAAARLVSVAKPTAALHCKVSEKGALSVYGLNSRFPVTLYVEQWERLLAFVDTLKVFAKANSSKLQRKNATA